MRALRHSFPPLLLILVLGAVLCSCGDDSTTPRVEEFSLSLEVTNPDGSPAEGLTVAVWNLPVGGMGNLVQDTFKRRAATSVQFALPQSSVCDLVSYDLDGNLVENVIESAVLPAGMHAVILGRGVEYTAGLEVLRYELIARDAESGAELFRDDKLMTVIYLDYERIVTTNTDADGRWFSDDRTLVPGLYDIPTMMAVDESGEPFQQFTMSQDIRIHLYDEQGQVMKFERTMSDGPNTVKVEWDPVVPPTASAWDLDGSQVKNIEDALFFTTGAAPMPDLEFELSQNYPNPYN